MTLEDGKDQIDDHVKNEKYYKQLRRKDTSYMQYSEERLTGLVTSAF
jgi:hypothetical protein